jgi:hypothetical protein
MSEKYIYCNVCDNPLDSEKQIKQLEERLADAEKVINFAAKSGSKESWAVEYSRICIRSREYQEKYEAKNEI